MVSSYFFTWIYYEEFLWPTSFKCEGKLNFNYVSSPTKSSKKNSNKSFSIPLEQ